MFKHNAHIEGIIYAQYTNTKFAPTMQSKPSLS